MVCFWQMPYLIYVYMYVKYRCIKHVHDDCKEHILNRLWAQARYQSSTSVLAHFRSYQHFGNAIMWKGCFQLKESSFSIKLFCPLLFILYIEIYWTKYVWPSFSIYPHTKQILEFYKLLFYWFILVLAKHASRSRPLMHDNEFIVITFLYKTIIM